MFLPFQALAAFLRRPGTRSPPTETTLVLQNLHRVKRNSTGYWVAGQLNVAMETQSALCTYDLFHLGFPDTSDGATPHLDLKGLHKKFRLPENIESTLGNI